MLESFRPSEGHQFFYEQLNRQILSLCASLPRPLRTDGLIFFTQYAGLAFGDKLEFFRNFSAPSWSIVYHLLHLGSAEADLDSGIKNAAISAHAMAMCIHSIDDHLVDGQVATTPLTLLIRSQAWCNMQKALELLKTYVPAGVSLVEDCIDRYYYGLTSAKQPKTLDSFCLRFKDQMAIGLIVPLILTLRFNVNPALSIAVKKAHESFGIAWRLIDDISDFPADMKVSAVSAVYFCLDKKRQCLWMNHAGGKTHEQQLFAFINKADVFGFLKTRIRDEIQNAAAVMESVGIYTMAQEYRSLLIPFQ